MEKLKRYIVFLIGLFINSLGVSLITKASLGTSPISSIPYVLSLKFPFTLGNFTIFFSIFLIILQIIILRKNFKPENLLQIPISILFGYFIDWTMLLFGWFTPDNYIVKIVALLIGCVILGFGVYTEVLANVAMLPGESFVRAITQVWHTDFGITKIVFDVSMAVIAAVLSVRFMGALTGVREGTIIAALLVGYIARQFGKIFKNAEKVLFASAKEENAEQPEVQAGADEHFVITIGRQYGCGGRQIGKELADRLGIAFYDRDIIKMAAGTTGYTPEYVSRQEEKITNSLLFDLVNQMYVYNPQDGNPKDKIFEAESKVIKELADKESCVIVGRMSDYILKDRPDTVRIFLHTSFDNRVANIMERNVVTRQLARDEIIKEEKRRGDNYRHYTGQVWGFAGNYDITVDSVLGIDLIEHIVKETLALKQK